MFSMALMAVYYLIAKTGFKKTLEFGGLLIILEFLLALIILYFVPQIATASGLIYLAIIFLGLRFGDKIGLSELKTDKALIIIVVGLVLYIVMLYVIAKIIEFNFGLVII